MVNESSILLSFLGYISLNDGYNVLYERGEKPFKQIESILNKSDLVLDNLECLAESKQGENLIKKPRLKTKLETLNYLKDINLGCSGYMYGLQVAFLYASQSEIRKVLLLNGETKSKAYSKKDKATSLLFGDGGTATLIEKIEQKNPTIMSMHSNGAGYKFILMPAGGYRYPSSVESLKEKIYPDGSIRTDEQGSMDGEAVFNFSITDVPKDIKSTLEAARLEWDQIDYFVPHQANRFITNHIAKKFKLPSEKVLYSLQKYGNTSSVSIPLTLVDHFGNRKIAEKTLVLMCGFGVGLSWGTVITDLNGCRMCGVKEL